MGVLAWEVMAGAAPFAGASVHEVQRNVLHTQVRVPDDWPGVYREFVTLCLTRRPDVRPDAVDLLSHRLLAGLATGPLHQGAAEGH